MKKIFASITVIAIAFGITGCTEQQQSIQRENQRVENTKDIEATKNCTYGGTIRQSVKNNWTFREDIREDYRSCVKDNSNRGADYEELTAACLETAHKLNDGILSNNWSRS